MRQLDRPAKALLAGQGTTAPTSRFKVAQAPKQRPPWRPAPLSRSYSCCFRSGAAILRSGPTTADLSPLRACCCFVALLNRPAQSSLLRSSQAGRGKLPPASSLMHGRRRCADCRPTGVWITAHYSASPACVLHVLFALQELHSRGDRMQLPWPVTRYRRSLAATSAAASATLPPLPPRSESARERKPSSRASARTCQAVGKYKGAGGQACLMLRLDSTTGQ